MFIKSISSKAGTVIPTSKLTVLVGPNNCGKSQTLRDIKEYIKNDGTRKLVSIQDLDIQLPTKQDTLRNVICRSHPTLASHNQILGVGSDLQSRHDVAISRGQLDTLFDPITNLPNDQNAFLMHFGNCWVAHLDAERRFQLTAPTASYDVRHGSPENALQAFFSQGKSATEKLRQAFSDAFGVDIALDWAAMSRFALSIGSNFGAIPDTREELDTLLKNAEQLATQGDGYRSFAGVVLSTLTFADRVLLLDEPEAFLHPAQARTLGRWIGTESNERSGQIIVATHSADFLLGIVSENKNTAVIRLNRSSSGTHYHIVPPETTAKLMGSPLLSSQPVMDALFHRGVVVCEGDADRAIYQTIAHSIQILGADSDEDLLFIHSNGKDAAAIPVELLRESGTPVCTILDIDILNTQNLLVDVVRALTGSDPDQRLMQLRDSVAASVEALDDSDRLELIKESVRNWLLRNDIDLRQARKSLKGIADEGAAWDRVKKSGIDYFQGQSRSDVEILIKDLEKIGAFLVVRGELESWMDFLSLPKGSKWNRAALEELANQRCPQDLSEFIRKIIKYFSD